MASMKSLAMHNRIPQQWTTIQPKLRQYTVRCQMTMILVSITAQCMFAFLPGSAL